jgi:subtilisin family serine protease
MKIFEKIPNYQPHFIFPALSVILSSIFVWGAFLYSRQDQRIALPPGSIEELHPAIARPVTREELEDNVATHSLSSIASVDQQIIEEFENESRKIITPKSEADTERITEIIESQGGTVISTNQSTIVVDIPEQEADSINQTLEDENLTEDIEVDHPIYVLAETDLWNLDKIDAPKAWEVTRGNGIRVGVIDTGIDYTHPELSGRYAGGYDNVDEDNDPMDGHGHGTHVTGIIASSLNNFGVAGVSPEVSIYAYKAIADSGVGYTSDLIESLDSAIKDNIQTVNISIGTDQPSVALESKLNQAVNQGMVIVAAAGNTGGGAVMYPAAYDSVISVAATDVNDQFASFSSLGAEISAPGVNILSTALGGGYTTLSGTSMAAPHVTATSALLIANGNTTVRQTLYDSTIDLGSEGPDGIFGYGLVQAGESVSPTSPSPTPELPSPTPSPSLVASPSATPQISASPSASPIIDEDNEATKTTRPVIQRRTKIDDSWFRRIFEKETESDDSDLVEDKDESSQEDSQANEETNKSSYSFLGDDNRSDQGLSASTDGVKSTVRTIFKVVTDVIKNSITNDFDVQNVIQPSPSPTPYIEENDAETEERSQNENQRRDEENREKSQSEPNDSRRGSVRGATTVLSFEEKIFNLVWDLLKAII